MPSVSTQKAQNKEADQPRTGQYTVSQLIRTFATEFPKSSNYPRHARAYVDDCLKKGIALDGISYAQYTADLPPNRVSPIRKFILFYQRIGQPAIIPNPKTEKISTAANDLIGRFIGEASNLKGEHSKQTYTKALQTFFIYINKQHQLGQLASLSSSTVAAFVQYLEKADYSPYTINLYLSATKQLAAWCVRQNKSLKLNKLQINELRKIDNIRGLAVERASPRDCLEIDERNLLLSGVDSLADRVILVLLTLKGLRPSDLTRLRVGNLDFENQQIHVPNERKKLCKAINFLAECREIVERYLIESNRWPLTKECQNELLFSNLKAYQIRYIVDKHLRKHGLKRKGISAQNLGMDSYT
ncbi:tyrosine-type recombinase/integrase [Larkinella insperata]|uniref:Tyrosine-type recombinase/integrase n=1 Tax=Larkinella insperata TaxID=332158 RepID=A0ABW3QI05_9BACT